MHNTHPYAFQIKTVRVAVCTFKCGEGEGLSMAVIARLARNREG